MTFLRLPINLDFAQKCHFTHYEIVNIKLNFSRKLGFQMNDLGGPGTAKSGLTFRFK